MGYVVMVDDNFHFMDKAYRRRLGEFEDVQVALGHCRHIVDEYLDALYENYVMFGEDPYICGGDAAAMEFSAWIYARERSNAMCGEDHLPSLQETLTVSNFNSNSKTEARNQPGPTAPARKYWTDGLSPEEAQKVIRSLPRIVPVRPGSMNHMTAPCCWPAPGSAP
jgi:hypothetical protein